MIIKLIGAYIAVVAFSGLLGVQKKYLPYTGTVGVVGWFIYLICEKYEFSVVFATFASVVVITFISHVYARVFKAPVTIFLISGIIPLVPGAGMYRIAYYILEGNNQMLSYYARETLLSAGMIALAIFLIDSMFRVVYAKKWKKKADTKETS